MGSTSFLGFSCPSLLLVFLIFFFFLGTCFIFFPSVGTFSGSFLFDFSVPYLGIACDHGNPFLVSLPRRVRKRKKVLDRGQNGFYF